MPLYDFACDDCDTQFEVSRSMKDAGIPAHCPHCDKQARRVFLSPMMNTGAKEAPPPAAKTPAADRWSHHGHSHGIGASTHAHGAPMPAAPPVSTDS